MAFLVGRYSWRPDSRYLFWGIALVILFALPLLSLDAGISGDEPVHYHQAELVDNYFSSKGEDARALETPETFLKLYGQAFDNLSYKINQLLGNSDPYRTRHLMNSFVGALTMILCGLLAVQLAGYATGILALIFIFLSPRFLGHSFNNLKDIPFAFGYLLAVYSLIRYTKGFPQIGWKWIVGMAVGTGFALATRPGGLILFPIIAFFTGWQAVLKKPKKHVLAKPNLTFFLRLLGATILLFLVAFGLGIMDWPYALQNPWVHPFRALSEMTRYQVSIRQLFEGQLTWSEYLPWYYVLKWFLIGSPAVILFGLSLFIIRLLRVKVPLRLTSIILLFCAFFPFVWVILKNSNLYGGYRHFLFVYPFFCVFASISWMEILAKFRHRWVKRIWMALLCVGLIAPGWHILRNHPLEYIYFNKINGGTNKAIGVYETDYYFHSLGPAFKWLQESRFVPTDKPLTVASNFPLDAYLDYMPEIKWVYAPYYERGKFDWDVGLFISSGISPSQLREGAWPPLHTIHTIDVDQEPIAAIVLRETKSDLRGVENYRSGDFLEAIHQFNMALITDSTNEVAVLYLGYTYRALGQWDESMRWAKKLIQIHPESEPARILIGLIHLSNGHFSDALESARDVIRINHKFKPAYALALQACDSLGDAKQSRYYQTQLSKY